MISLVAFGVANAEIEFGGVIDPMVTVTSVDSVILRSPDMTFFTTGWGSHFPYDTFVFTGVPAWPETVTLHGTGQAFYFHCRIPHPDTSTWVPLWFGLNEAKVKFYGSGYGGVEESKPAVAPLPRLTVSPSVVTGQMTVRLQAVGTGRSVVEIHDAAGNVIRSLDCTAGSDGSASATWNREDEFGRPVPEGVYFCRYAAADVIAVRKVLVAH